ncbi:MAG: FAD-binding oxidoreductase [Steroidobacteraceae bacterium]|jgi:FAD/FMN-containing dehydrogenase|nr:FAD-binding oxidoreductase [Steroidobacteraceae bacterium]
MSAESISELRGDLRAIVGEQGLLTGDSVRERAGLLFHGRVDAELLVRPRDTNQVSRVLALCHARGQPVVTHGGLTGLVNGADAARSELVLSLESMNSIERVDVAGRTLRAQAGAKLGNVQREAEKNGMVFPLDLGARDSATVGGNISTNAGGLRVLRYGMMRNLVLGIEAVLADGTVLTSMNRMLKNNAGYDLKQLFIGSEGTLGVVTRAELRLVSRTRSQETLLAALPTFDALVELLDRLDSGLGGQLAAFEALWGNYYDLNTAAPASNAPPLSRGAAFYAIAETLGGDPEADRARLEAVLGEAMEAGVVSDVTLANSETERRAIWNIREDVWQPRHIAPLLTFDVSLPIENMKAYVEQVNAAVHEFAGENRSFVFGHMADGNLHIVVAAGDDAATRARVEEIVYRPLAAIGGSVSAEHGIGLEKRAYLPLSRSAEEIATMRTIKRALDPKGILNPGKVFS